MTRSGSTARILVIDDDAAIRDSLRMILEYQGYAVMTAATGDEGAALVEREAPDLVFLDIKMPGMDGLEVLQRLTHLTDVTPIVVMSGHATISTAVEATRLGAFDFMEKPLETERVLVLVRNAVDSRRLRTENRSLRKDQEKRHQIVGDSAGLGVVKGAIQKAAPTNATVLIWGESGVGKELVARAVHRESLRRDGPFVQVNCAAIPDDLIESELFGHEKGSFTGAHQRRIGAFERATTGTLFLDELGELSLELQPKLLRALERREVQRLGGDKPTPIDVRIIAATNRDLRSMVARGEFREDLYYRLAVVTLELPPLRERKEDIELLVDHFLKGMSMERAALPEGAIERFLEHPWPGNARELKNAVERAVVLGETRFLQTGGSAPVALPHNASAGVDGDAPRGAYVIDATKPYKDQKSEVIADFEERYARLLMKEHQGNVSAAARVAGIDRMSLHKILARYGLDARELAKS